MSDTLTEAILRVEHLDGKRENEAEFRGSVSRSELRVAVSILSSVAHRNGCDCLEPFRN